MDFRVVGFQEIRRLLRPEEGLRAVVERATQLEESLGMAVEKLRPARTRLYEGRRRLATGAVLLLTAWLFIHVMFGENGMVVYKQKKTEIHRLQGDIDSLQQENERITNEIKALKSDPKAIEKEAREQLHYARPGEVVYVTPNPPNPPKPDTSAARK